MTQQNPTTLILVPSDQELQWFAPEIEAWGKPPRSTLIIRRCGVGLVMSALVTQQLIEECRPDRVVLAGIAGTFDANRLPVGSAQGFDRVSQFGLGQGGGVHHRPWHRTDLVQFDELPESLPLWQLNSTRTSGRLISVSAVSQSLDEAQRVRDEYPDALAEDMEAYSVALVCRLRSIPCAVIRGISNGVGVRTNWNIPDALMAAQTTLANVLKPVLELD